MRMMSQDIRLPVPKFVNELYDPRWTSWVGKVLNYSGFVRDYPEIIDQWLGIYPDRLTLMQKKKLFLMLLPIMPHEWKKCFRRSKEVHWCAAYIFITLLQDYDPHAAIVESPSINKTFLSSIRVMSKIVESTYRYMGIARYQEEAYPNVDNMMPLACSMIYDSVLICDAQRYRSRVTNESNNAYRRVLPIITRGYYVRNSHLSSVMSDISHYKDELEREYPDYELDEGSMVMVLKKAKHLPFYKRFPLPKRCVKLFIKSCKRVDRIAQHVRYCLRMMRSDNKYWTSLPRHIRTDLAKRFDKYVFENGLFWKLRRKNKPATILDAYMPHSNCHVYDEDSLPISDEALRMIFASTNIYYKLTTEPYEWIAVDYKVVYEYVLKRDYTSIEYMYIDMTNTVVGCKVMLAKTIDRFTRRTLSLTQLRAICEIVALNTKESINEILKDIDEKWDADWIDSKEYEIIYENWDIPVDISFHSGCEIRGNPELLMKERVNVIYENWDIPVDISFHSQWEPQEKDPVTYENWDIPRDALLHRWWKFAKDMS